VLDSETRCPAIGQAGEGSFATLQDDSLELKSKIRTLSYEGCGTHLKISECCCGLADLLTARAALAGTLALASNGLRQQGRRCARRRFVVHSTLGEPRARWQRPAAARWARSVPNCRGGPEVTHGRGVGYAVAIGQCVLYTYAGDGACRRLVS
jgi:hypothetical protein